MYASYQMYDIRGEILSFGLHLPRDANGYVNRIPVILCQHTPYLIGQKHGDPPFAVVEFVVDKVNNVLVDWVDFIDMEMVEEDEFDLEEHPATHADVPSDVLDKCSTHGNYVRQINPEQIIAIHRVEWRESGPYAPLIESLNRERTE